MNNKSKIILIIMCFLCSRVVAQEILVPDSETGRFIQSEQEEDIDVINGTNIRDDQILDVIEIKFEPNYKDSLNGSIKMEKSPGIITSENHDLFHKVYFDVDLNGNITKNVGYKTRILNNNRGLVFSDSYLETALANKAYKLQVGRTSVLSGTDFIINDDDLRTSNPAVKLRGGVKMLGYSLGMYKNDSIQSDYSKSGIIELQPLYKNPKMGTLKIGGGYYNRPYNQISSSTYTLFSGYNKGRFGLRSEYLRKYKGDNTEYYDEKWAVSNSIGLTKALDIIAKYRIDNSTLERRNDLSLKYDFSKSHILKVQNLNLLLNASYIDNVESEYKKNRFEIKTNYALPF